MSTTLRKIVLTFGAGTCLACSHRRAEVEPASSTPVMETTTTTSTSIDTTRSMSTMSSTTTDNSGSSSPAMRTSAAARSDEPGNAMARREVHSAIHTLTRAKFVLEHASHQFGGHRTGALKAVDNALHELHTAAGREMRPQTAREEKMEEHEIRRAVLDLEHARHDMETAKHDFGGRRAETLRAVDESLRELRLAAENER